MSDLTAVFLILAVLSWGSGAFLDKLTLRYLGPDTAFFGRTFVMLGLFLPLLFFRFTQTKSELLAAGRISWLYLFLSVVVTMGGVFFYLKAMSASEASRIVPLSSTYPLVTMVLALFFLGESVSLSKAAGAIFISFGVYLISK